MGIFLMGIFYTWPDSRPVVMFSGIVTFAICGYINGFMTSRTLKFFKLADWKTSALMAALLFPCCILLTLSMGDWIEAAMGSSAAVPFSEGLLHYLAWWALDAPAAAYGAYRGFILPLSVDPNISQQKRSIPALPWHLRSYTIVTLYGPIIFATIFFEF